MCQTNGSKIQLNCDCVVKFGTDIRVSTLHFAQELSYIAKVILLLENIREEKLTLSLSLKDFKLSSLLEFYFPVENMYLTENIFKIKTADRSGRAI
jgi:hypothetical protein